MSQVPIFATRVLDGPIRPLSTTESFDDSVLNMNYNVDNPHSDQELNNMLQVFRDRLNEISAQQDAATSRRNELLEAILNELRAIRESTGAIRQDQVIIKEALLYAPGGPGADQARQSFEAHQK